MSEPAITIPDDVAAALSSSDPAGAEAVGGIPTIARYRTRLMQAPEHRAYIDSRPTSAPGLVSVITVVYNRRASIQRAIDSVLAQSYPDIEYIIVDGGSTDGTLEVLRGQATRLSYLVSEKDDGISDAFNKGLALSHGGIVGILNSDDLYHPDAVRLSVEALKAASVGFSHGGCQFLRGDRKAFVRPVDPRFEDRMRRGLPGIFHPTMFVKRGIYETLGLFRGDLKYAMDFDFMLRCLRSGVTGASVDHQLATMSVDGISSTRTIEAAREARGIARQHGIRSGLIRSWLGAAWTMARNRLS